MFSFKKKSFSELWEKGGAPSVCHKPSHSQCYDIRNRAYTLMFSEILEDERQKQAKSTCKGAEIKPMKILDKIKSLFLRNSNPPKELEWTGTLSISNGDFGQSLISAKEAANMLKVSISTIYGWKMRGEHKDYLIFTKSGEHKTSPLLLDREKFLYFKNNIYKPKSCKKKGGKNVK